MQRKADVRMVVPGSSQGRCRPGMHRIGHLVAEQRVVGGVGTAVEGLIEAGGSRGDDHRTVVATASGARVPRWATAAAAALKLGHAARPDLDAAVAELDGLVVHGVFHPGVARAARYVADRFPLLPTVVLPHDAYDDALFERRRPLKMAYFAAVERPRLQSARGVLVTAPSHEAWLRRRGITTPVRSAPLGLSQDDRRSAQGVRRSRPLGGAGPVRLLFVGRWDVHEKGLDLLLPAVAALPAGAAALRVVGPPLGNEKAVSRLAAGAADRVELVGWVPDVWAEIAKADLVVLPSRKEGFGIAGLQALAAGVPLLLSRRAGLAEHVGAHDGVHLATPDDAGVRAGLDAALTQLPRLAASAVQFAAGPGPGPGWSYDPLCDALLASFEEPRPRA